MRGEEKKRGGWEERRGEDGRRGEGEEENLVDDSSHTAEYSISIDNIKKDAFTRCTHVVTFACLYTTVTCPCSLRRYPIIST